MPSVQSRFFVALFVAGVSMGAFADPLSPVGSWSTIDDKTHQPKSVVRITEAGGVLSGTVEKIIDPAKQDSKCDDCAHDDPRKGKPVLGMTILTGLKKEGDNVYGGGQILDPNNGKTYNAKVTVIDGGRKLEMRGSILFFGRTQTWIRVN